MKGRITYRFVPVPLDSWGIVLTPIQRAIYDYLCLHTVRYSLKNGARKTSVKLSYRELATGRRDRERKKLDGGCGVKGRNSIRSALAALKKYGLVGWDKSGDAGRRRIEYSVVVAERGSGSVADPDVAETGSVADPDRTQTGSVADPPMIRSGSRSGQTGSVADNRTEKEYKRDSGKTRGRGAGPANGSAPTREQEELIEMVAGAKRSPLSQRRPDTRRRDRPGQPIEQPGHYQAPEMVTESAEDRKRVWHETKPAWVKGSAAKAPVRCAAPRVSKCGGRR